MKFLILGASGQLGKNLRTTASKYGFNIDYPKKVKFDLALLIRELKELNPDILVNATAWTKVDEAETNRISAFNTNVILPEIMAKACQVLQIPFVHFSTDYVFSGNKFEDWEINDSHQPVNYYGKTKSIGEKRILQNYSENTYIFRTSWLYSEFNDNFAKKIVRHALMEQKNIKVVNDLYGQPTNAQDLAERVFESLQLGLQPGTYHASNTGMTTWYDYAGLIYSKMNKNSDSLIPIEVSELKLEAKRPKCTVLGNMCWNTFQLGPMRKWTDSLDARLDRIIEQVKKEV